MYFSYFDESGDTGRTNSPTDAFVLSGLLVHDRDWLSALDQTIAFRRYLRDNFHIMPRAELKATWLVHNKGQIRPSKLTFKARLAAYKAVMRFQRKSGVFHTFGVFVDKRKINTAGVDIREYAWRYALQRLERFGTSKKDNLHVLPDEGHGEFIRKKIRLMRRFSRIPSAYGGSTLDRSAENILEDPSDRRSHESFFIQMADLNAYAAFRKVFPGNNFGGEFWDELGDSRIKEVNSLRGGPHGIVVWPT